MPRCWLGTAQIYATLPGSEPGLKRIVMGSHCDSVKNGGNYDGILGVMSAMEVLETVVAENIPHKHPLTAMIFTNEEGSEFPPCMMCSGIMAHDYMPERFRDNFEYSKMMASHSILTPEVTFGERLAAFPYKGDKANRMSPEKYKALFETHIEQGPILEDAGKDIGVVTCVLGLVFTDLFKIHGAVMAYSESLLYSGYQDLSLTQIFMASIFIGASGAVMDLSVDITSAVHEVVKKRPDLSWQEAARSGLNVGRAAMGTMTTTLLFAYSGGYIALLMVFMAQGTPVDHILNYKYVAAEIIHTVIGSFGLVTVAPFTALCAGLFLARRGGHPQPQKESDG